MIVVTGAAGFIGSQIAHLMAIRDKTSLVCVDKLALFNERSYVSDLKSKATFVDAENFTQELQEGKFSQIKLVIHMGAITNTGETDKAALDKWNVNYTKAIWSFCTKNQIPLIYASSAATYGNGSQGFSDAHDGISKLKPLNLYGKSKHEFDLWALDQKLMPPNWYGLKFFNVYGPNENHKGRMASSIFHGYNEITQNGQMTLFKSHNPNYKDGEQARDFIFIKDILSIIEFLLEKKPANGIYNCGTGHAGTFKELAASLFKTLDLPEKINWVDTPQEFRAAYQYRTEADSSKLRSAGYTRKFTPLSEGVYDYVQWLNKITN